MDLKKVVITQNAGETERAGEEFARGLRGGELVLLRGELGSGKTAFVRGMARGLGVDDPEGVSSPSYTLANEYEGPVRLIHADLYRIDSAAAIGELALEEMIGPDAVVVVEWGEKLAPAGLEVIEVDLRALGEDKREIEFHHRVEDEK
ncbi:MAG TPA: tRNA (adenosine(37)-N6)-threonylcarbamoyltransferase complex ATPase subunit type 1 TsaE [Acidobacteriota bacterium]|nr:tRNA (adenosine(37)-N6)-threonylcarbamoyltransferase complex ATPase subunit type 1 TsaE [Acidobacteriota bacterium]